MSGQSISSLAVRQRSRDLEKKHHLSKEQARQLARAVPEGEVPEYWLDNLDDAIHCWDLGRDLHDLRLAARHAVAIVRSVKQLAGADHERSEDVSVNDTINKSLSLLQRELRHISVVIRPASNLPTIRASSSELVQVWVNIIKNAAEAMSDVESPHIEVVTKEARGRLVVTITNNGPQIDEATRRQIFQPNFTTKKVVFHLGWGWGCRLFRGWFNNITGQSQLRVTSRKQHSGSGYP